MKQGTIVNRIVMLVLFAALMIYLIVSAWQGFTGRITTVTSYSYTLDDLQEATGFLARDEYVLPARSALADVLPAEGEKVSVGQTVAYLYQSADALERKQDIRTLTLEKEQLEYSLGRTDDLSDNAKLTKEIMQQLAGLRASVSRRDFTGLEDSAMELKGLVYKRDYTSESGGDLTALQAQIAKLTEDINNLQSKSSLDTSAVYTDRSGIFSGLVDGYEALLTPAALETLTPSTLDKLAGESVKPESNTVGKLITSSRWYFVCVLPEDQAKRLVDGWAVDVRFSRDWSGEVNMTVERISAPENGRVAVVLSTTQHLSDTTLLRRQTVDIVFSSVTGIRVPKNALYQNESGQWGVYAVVGAQAEFKPITVVGEDDDYYLIQPLVSATSVEDKEGAKKALRPGDEIIISAEGLYDGKVVRQ